MSDHTGLRRVARIMLAVASLAFIGGAAVMVLGEQIIGDALMIGGGAMLLAGAGLLAWSGTPQGGGDAG